MFHFLHFYKLFLHVLILINISNATLRLPDYMFCGGLATAITDLLLYPIDTIKVAQQSSRVPLPILQALKKVKKESGNLGFYRGAYGYALVDGMGAAIFFAVYENIKSLFNKHIKSPLTPYISASISFVISSSFMVPAELIKVKMQSNAYSSLPQCLEGLWKFNNLGIKGFYQGYIAILVREIPYFSLQLGCYDNIRNILEKLKDKYDEPNNKFHIFFQANRLDLLASLMSGTITGLLTNPMDVVTARLMTQQPSSVFVSMRDPLANNIISSTSSTVVNNAMQNIPYTGMTNCIVRIAREEGLGAFFTGAVARVAWIAPFTAVSLCLNEEFRRQRIKQKQKQFNKMSSK